MLSIWLPHSQWVSLNCAPPWSAVPWHRFGQSADKSAHSKEAHKLTTTQWTVNLNCCEALAFVVWSMIVTCNS